MNDYSIKVLEFGSKTLFKNIPEFGLQRIAVESKPNIKAQKNKKLQLNSRIGTNSR
jgi:hypothetical protein